MFVINLKMDYKKEINSKTLMIILILLFLITIVSHLEIGYRVMKYGYLVIYNNSIPSIFPSIFNYVSTFFSLMVFISLSIFKEKKYIYTTLLLYFIYLFYDIRNFLSQIFC